jgi:hypothetical protein
MVYRKGELSKGTIDSQWPHQVAVQADKSTGANWVAIRDFCKGLSLCPRGHYFYRGAIGFNVYCFAEREHAELFRDRFDGELIEPKDRPRWPSRR